MRDQFFGNSLDGAINGNQLASAFFGPSGSAQRTTVINALVTNAVGGNVNPQAATAARNEADALITKIATTPALSSTVTVAKATTAVCTAVLGSGAVTFQ